MPAPYPLGHTQPDCPANTLAASAVLLLQCAVRTQPGLAVTAFQLPRPQSTATVQSLQQPHRSHPNSHSTVT
jgi:hypothetical protein